MSPDQSLSPTNIDPQWLDRMYNNRALVPDFANYFARWQDASQDARLALEPALDVAYGTGLNETLDVYSPTRGPKKGAPVVVFIHGGYWRSLDKADHSFLASPFVDQGHCVVMPNYALCPAVTIPDICLQMVKAMTWVWANVHRYGGDPRRITVWGHSAGGHLAAMMQSVLWKLVDTRLPADLVKSSLSVSGLYDLTPLPHTPFLQESLRLSAADALRASPAFMRRPATGALFSVAGGDESPEFIRQNALIRKAWGKKSVPVCEALPGLNHFSIVEALTEPGHRLNQLAFQLASDL